MLCSSPCTLSGDTVLKHSITDDVLINHLIKVMSASHFHCEVFGRGWSILRKCLPYQNVNLHFYLLYQYGLSASYITPIIMYHNPWLLFILMFTLFQPWTVGISLSQALCPFDIFPSFFEQFDAFGTRYSRLILYFPWPCHGINNFSQKSQKVLVENGI